MTSPVAAVARATIGHRPVISGTVSMLLIFAVATVPQAFAEAQE